MACRGCGLQRRGDPLLVSRKWNGLCCSICHSLQVRGPFRGRLPKSGDPLLQAFKEASLAKRQLAYDRLHRRAAHNGPPTAAISAQGLPTRMSLSRMTDAELWRMHSLLLGSLRMVAEEMMARHQESSRGSRKRISSSASRLLQPCCEPSTHLRHRAPTVTRCRPLSPVPVTAMPTTLDDSSLA